MSISKKGWDIPQAVAGDVPSTIPVKGKEVNNMSAKNRKEGVEKGETSTKKRKQSTRFGLQEESRR